MTDREKRQAMWETYSAVSRFTLDGLLDAALHADAEAFQKKLAQLRELIGEQSPAPRSETCQFCGHAKVQLRLLCQCKGGPKSNTYVGAGNHCTQWKRR